MFEHSLERRLAIDVAEQADRSRVEVRGHLDLSFLGRVDDRFDAQVIVQGLATASMNVPNRGADLRVAVGVDVFLKKVHKTSIPLQDREVRKSGPVGTREKSGSTRAAKSGSVRIRQKALRASKSRFKSETSR